MILFCASSHYPSFRFLLASMLVMVLAFCRVAAPLFLFTFLISLSYTFYLMPLVQSETHFVT